MSAGAARLRRVLAGSVLGVILAYGVTVGGLYAAQRSMIFPAPAGFADIPAGYERVGVNTADGLTLAAAWRPPTLGKPTALFFHGNGDSWAGGARAMQALADAGYGVLLPEYRGYGTNPGQPGEQDFYRDGHAALDWLGAQGIRADRVVLVGNSIGSGTATQLAADTPVAALILISPFASLPDLVAEKFPWLPGRWLVRDRFDNAAKLSRVRAPVLVLHGTADTMVPPVHARRLAQAQPRARLILVPGTDHDLAYLPQAQLAEAAWLEQVVP
jgi:pimeloyl-ACP methyl ester carboxylesterase